MIYKNVCQHNRFIWNKIILKLKQSAGVESCIKTFSYSFNFTMAALKLAITGL